MNAPAVKQSTVTLISPLRSTGKWRKLAHILRTRGDQLQDNLDARAASGFDFIPQLHFLSMFVIPPDRKNKPLLCLEANFDGAKRDFLDRLAEKESRLLHKAYSFCIGYSRTGPTTEQLADFLEDADCRSELFYVGCPGRGAAQIEEEAGLADRVEQCVRQLGAPSGRRSEYVRRIWRALRPRDRDLVRDTPKQPFWARYRILENPLPAIYALVRWPLIAAGTVSFVLVLLQGLGWALPEVIAPPAEVVAATCEWAKKLLWLAGAVVLLLLLQLWAEFPRALTARMRRYVLAAKVGELAAVTLGASLDLAIILGLLALWEWHAKSIVIVAVCVIFVLLGLLVLSAIITVAALVWIGFEEQKDDVYDMAWDSARLTKMRRREDRLAQNHFISVTTIRPSWVRAATLWVWLHVVHVAARIFYNPRGLFNIPSIHFARWHMLRGGRLLFVPHYAGSFGGYLGQFATFGGGGVSGIWGNTVGFPRTFLLFFGGGARDEQGLKCRARDSQIESLLWYRRYPRRSVGAIQRNALIREELQRFSLSLAAGAERVTEAELDAFLRRF